MRNEYQRPSRAPRCPHGPAAETTASLRQRRRQDLHLWIGRSVTGIVGRSTSAARRSPGSIEPRPPTLGETSRLVKEPVKKEETVLTSVTSSGKSEEHPWKTT